ncbi:MAG: LamG domain-containing protein [bacterium]
MKLIFYLLCSIFFIFPLSICSAVDPNLVIYMPMNDGKGDTVKDLSPNGFDGKIVGGNYKWINGKIGNGIEMTAETEIQIPDNDMLDGMKALTLEIWLKQDTHQSTGVVQKGTNWPDMSYLLQPWSDQQVYFGISNTSSRAIAPAGSYPLGEWYHLAATFDGTTLKVFINGKEKASAKSPVAECPDTNTPLQVGNRFAGVIDEFVMYNRALTDDEIKTDMAGVSLSIEAKNKLPILWGYLKLME